VTDLHHDVADDGDGGAGGGEVAADRDPGLAGVDGHLGHNRVGLCHGAVGQVAGLADLDLDARLLVASSLGEAKTGKGFNDGQEKDGRESRELLHITSNAIEMC